LTAKEVKAKRRVAYLKHGLEACWRWDAQVITSRISRAGIPLDQSLHPAFTDVDERSSLLLDSDHEIRFGPERVGDVNDTCNDDKHGV
jgi:hypothetical protein